MEFSSHEKTLKPVKVLRPRKDLRKESLRPIGVSSRPTVLKIKIPVKYGQHLLPIEQDYKRPDSPDPRTKLYSCDTPRGKSPLRRGEEKLQDYPCSPKNWLNGRLESISLSLPDW